MFQLNLPFVAYNRESASPTLIDGSRKEDEICQIKVWWHVAVPFPGDLCLWQSKDTRLVHNTQVEALHTLCTRELTCLMK